MTQDHWRPDTLASRRASGEQQQSTNEPVPPRGRGRVLILVQNLSVPFDRRVWLECQSLVGAGFEVTVVCPKAPGDPTHSRLNGVDLFKYRPYAPGGSSLSFVIEYAYSFFATLLLSLRASWSGRFTVVQSCNPPDLFWPIGIIFRLLHGSAFVFDHHDLCPELYLSRFPDGNKLVYRVLRFMERRTMRTADHVIATNDSYRQIAVGARRSRPDARDGRPDGAGSDPTQSYRGGTGPPPCQAPSGCIPGCHGPAGWRRPRTGGR